jgi:hypothetical protein
LQLPLYFKNAFIIFPVFITIRVKPMRSLQFSALFCAISIPAFSPFNLPGASGGFMLAVSGNSNSITINLTL